MEYQLNNKYLYKTLQLLDLYTDKIFIYNREAAQIHVYKDNSIPDFAGRSFSLTDFRRKYAAYVQQIDMLLWRKFFSAASLNAPQQEKQGEVYCIRMSDDADCNEYQDYEFNFDEFDEDTMLISGKKKEQDCEKIAFTPVKRDATKEKEVMDFIDKGGFGKKSRECGMLNYVTPCAISGSRCQMESAPIAYCIVKVMLDKQGEPCDLVFVYANAAYSKLEGFRHGELIGKSFYQLFGNADKKWLKYYYDTAYNGVPHKLDEYSPEFDKYLLIGTHQVTKGYCSSIFYDVTMQKKLELDLKRSNERIRRILQSTTDFVFQLDLQTREMTITNENMPEGSVSTIENVPQGLIERDLIEPQYAEQFWRAINRLKQGEKDVSFDFRGRVNPADNFRWYNITMFDYRESYSGKVHIIGYMKNIDQIMSQYISLKKDAEKDSLTGLFNRRAGRQLIEQKLENEYAEGKYQVFFFMDLDNFKKINDLNGHQAGDKALQLFAQAIQHNFRRNDIIFRLGGDEFIAFLSGVKGSHDFIKRIVSGIFKELEGISLGKMAVSSSIGVFITDKKRSYDYVYERADKALYEAKRRGKNTFVIEVDE